MLSLIRIYVLPLREKSSSKSGDDKRKITSSQRIIPIGLTCPQTGFHNFGASDISGKTYPFPTLSFRAQREIFFVPFFHDSFAKPFTGSTAYRLSAIRRFPFFAIGHSPSYRQRKRSLGSARDDDTGRTFSHTLYDTADIHSLHCHFERSEKSFSSPFSLLLR